MASLLALFLINLAVMNAVTGAGDDARIGALRLSTVRAFYAAESGVTASIRQMQVDPESPLSGEYTLPNGEQVEIVTPFETGAGGDLVVEGRFGPALRRLEAEGG